tara:strand:- start:2494 stop:3903 length:1410 start_codon:yes stop_codon:yes gene_type:complete
MAKEVLEMEIKSNTGEVTKDVEQLDKATDKAAGGFKGMGTAIKGVGTALKAAGIGIIVALLAKLGEVFGKNQKVLDTFNTAMEFLSITFNDFFKFLSNNINTATSFMDKIFGNSAVQQVLQFGKMLSVEIITRVKNLIQGIGGLGKAIGKVFDGEFKEAGKVAGEALNNLKDAVIGNVAETVEMEKTITKITGKIKEYAKSTLEAAENLVELNKAAELAAAKNQKIIEQKDREAELQRQIRDDESKTFKQRIEANNKLNTILEEQETAMLANAQAIVDAAQAQKDKNASDENKIALIQAETEKEGVLAQITGFKSEQLVNNIALQKEQQAVAQENAEAQIEAFSNLAGSLSALAGENKELAAAGALIDTYAGANKAFAQGGVAGFVSGAAIIAAGLANLKKIYETPVSGSSGGSSGAGAIAQPPAPQMMSGAFQLSGGQAPEAMRAYVVTDEMTNSQNQLANIRRRATI